MKKKAVYHNIFGAISNFGFLFVTSIILLPFYFKYVNVADFGIWLGGISFLSIVSVLEANISLILTQKLGESWTNNDKEGFSKNATAAIFFGIITGFVMVFATYFFKDTLCTWVIPSKKTDSTFALSFLVYSASLSLSIVFGYLNCILQVFLKSLLPTIFNLLAAIVSIGYTVWKIPSEGIFAIATGNLLKVCIYGFFLTILVIKELRERKIAFQFESIYVVSLLQKIGLPLISKLGMTFAVNMQNFIVAKSISSSTTTLFEITKKLPFMTIQVINMFAVATFTSFSLFYSEQKNNRGNHEYTKHYFSLLKILLMFSLAGIFILGEGFVSFWVGLDNFGGNSLLALLCLNALTDQLRLILSQQYYAIGKFNITSVTDTLFAGSFMIMAFFLIPIFQLNGIVLAGIGANIFYFLCCFYLENRNGITLVPLILNWKYLMELIIFMGSVVIIKYIIDYFYNQLYVQASFFLIFFLSLAGFYYRKENVFFRFMILKLFKASKK
jgi:O-antigen/teichoic acid export membrane protein